MRNYKYKYIKIEDLEFNGVTRKTLEHRGYRITNIDGNRDVVVFKKICK